MLNAPVRLSLAVRFAVATALLVAGPVTALAEAVDPGSGRISWTLDHQPGWATQYARDSSRASICDVGIWDLPTYFAKVTYCETLSGWYWKPAYLNYDLMMDDFRDLQDFITAGPEPFRDIVTNVGEIELYGFDVDSFDRDAAWQCFAFIKGFNREDRGYQQMLVVYFCDDTGEGMTDARLDEALSGLMIEDVFDQLVN